MGKESDAMKAKKLDDPYENSDADRGEDAVDLSGCERKKRKEKRKHGSGCGIPAEFACAGNASENVKVDLDAEGEGLLRKKRKLDLDSGQSVDPDKPRKNDKKRKYREAEARPESDAVPLTGVDSYNEETGKKYEKGKFTRENDDDARSISEGVKGNKKEKKQGRSLVEGDGIIDNGTEGSKKGEDEGTTVQLDSEKGDNQKNHKRKKERKEKKKTTEKEGRKQGEDDDTTDQDDLGRDNQQKRKEKKGEDEKEKKEKEGSKRGKYEDTTDQLDSGNGDNQKNHKRKKEWKEKKKTEKEGRIQGADDDTTDQDDLGRDNQQKRNEKKKKRKKGKEGSKRGKYEDTTDQLDSGNGDKRKNKEKVKEKKKEQEEKNKSKLDKPAKKSSRKVRFADTVEIFPSPEVPSEGQAKGKDQLVHGKRFSPEEDALIEEAVNSYIETHGLGEDGLNTVLHCKGKREIRNCWKDIGAALPWRPYMSVYYRAHILFERGEKTGSWTEEERETIRNFHKEHGSDWRLLADHMGKHRIHVKDTWRRIKLPNLKRGNWSQEEYQALFDLVNKDLQMRALEEKVSKHGMLRDNICWEAISQRLSTRTNSTCCTKWYGQLTSSLVADGKWADSDDYRLLDALVNLDACSMEEVDWDCLIENRSGAVCRKRWAQMLRHIGGHGTKSFADQVDILSKRYCPSLLEAREAFENKIPKD